MRLLARNILHQKRAPSYTYITVFDERVAKSFKFVRAGKRTQDRLVTEDCEAHSLLSWPATFTPDSFVTNDAQNKP